jgi:class 3 adenylate cyclase
MFTDLVGFTEFISDHGDAVVLDLLAVQEQLVRQSLPPRARLVKELGDGLMLSFDDPCDAVATGLALQERFESEAANSDFPLWVRIGLHSGRPLPRGDDYVGNDVNIAARIVDLAAPGEVITSEATCHQAADRLEGIVFEPLDWRDAYSRQGRPRARESISSTAADAPAITPSLSMLTAPPSRSTIAPPPSLTSTMPAATSHG